MNDNFFLFFLGPVLIAASIAAIVLSVLGR